MSSSNKAVVQRFFDICGEAVTPETWQVLTQDANLLQLMADLRRLSPGCTLKMLDLIAEGDLVLAVFDLLDSDGQPTPWGGAILFKLEGNSIAEHWLVPKMSDLPEALQAWPFRA